MAAAVLLTILAIAGCAFVGYVVGLATSEYYSKKTTRIKVKADAEKRSAEYEKTIADLEAQDAKWRERYANAAD